MKTIRVKLYKLILILIGFVIFTVFIWFRFMQERLPRDIPFDLSFIGLILLIYICCIYIHILYELLQENRESNIVIKAMITYIYISLETLDQYVKNLPYINSYYKHSIVYLAYKLDTILIDNKLYYYIFAIFPHIILVIALVIDIFYFHCLFYIYKVILISILLLINRYIIYSLKYAKDHFINDFKVFVNISMPYEHAINIVEDTPPEDEDEDDFIPDTMHVPLKEFIEYITEYIYIYKKRCDFMVLTNQRDDGSYYVKQEDGSYTRYSSKEIFTHLEIDEKVENIIKISVLIMYYELYNGYDYNIKTMKTVIYGLYLICWSYIMIVSMHTLPPDSLMIVIDIIKHIEEPFTGLPLINEE